MQLYWWKFAAKLATVLIPRIHNKFTRGKTSEDVTFLKCAWKTLKRHVLQECRDECGSGMQLALEGQCEPCPRGTFRTQGVEAACQPCPTGRTTPKLGAATVEECSLPVCGPGQYWLNRVIIYMLFCIF